MTLPLPRVARGLRLARAVKLGLALVIAGLFMVGGMAIGQRVDISLVGATDGGPLAVATRPLSCGSFVSPTHQVPPDGWSYGETRCADRLRAHAELAALSTLIGIVFAASWFVVYRGNLRRRRHIVADVGDTDVEVRT